MGQILHSVHAEVMAEMVAFTTAGHSAVRAPQSVTKQSKILPEVIHTALPTHAGHRPLVAQETVRGEAPREVWQIAVQGREEHL